MVPVMGYKGTKKIVQLIFYSSLVAFLTITAVRATEDIWMLKAPVPMASYGVVVVKNKIYAIGPNDVAEYDPVADTWAFKKPMPTKGNDFAIAVYQDKIYVFGGSNGLNQVYDPASDMWETKTSMPTPRTQLDANVVNGKIYLIGGRTGGQYTTVNLNEVYDPTTDSWTTKEAIPYSVVQYASAVVDGKIYVIGGQDEFHDPMNLNLTQIYDPEADTWSFGTPIPNMVWQAAAGATTGEMAPKRIYVMGGLPEKSLFGTDLNQVYDPETDTWTLGARMPIARFNLKVAVVNDTLYVMGGTPHFNLEGIWSPENYQYTPIGYVPEFPSEILLSLFLAATFVAAITKKKLSQNTSTFHADS